MFIRGKRSANILYFCNSSNVTGSQSLFIREKWVTGRQPRGLKNRTSRQVDRWMEKSGMTNLGYGEMAGMWVII